MTGFRGWAARPPSLSLPSSTPNRPLHSTPLHTIALLFFLGNSISPRGRERERERKERKALSSSSWSLEPATVLLWRRKDYQASEQPRFLALLLRRSLVLYPRLHIRPSLLEQNDRACGLYLHRASERASERERERERASACLSVLLCPHVSTHREHLYEGFHRGREGERERERALMRPLVTFFLYVSLYFCLVKSGVLLSHFR